MKMVQSLPKHGMTKTKANIIQACIKQSDTIIASGSYVNDMKVRAMKDMANKRIGRIEALQSLSISKRPEPEKECDSQWKLEGASIAAATLYAQLEKLKAKHKVLETSSTSLEGLHNSAVGISALEDALQFLRVDKSMTSTKTDLELLEVCNSTILFNSTGPYLNICT